VAETSAIQAGDRLPDLAVQPDLAQVVRYCGLTWDAPAFFYDAEAAKAAGLPGTIIPGPLKLALLYRAIDAWLDGRGSIRQVRGVNRRPDVTNSRLTISGEVMRVYEEDGSTRADLELRVLQEGGEASVSGTAVVELSKD
jgi:hydroxyacyl-ACP dehydratase HTD2-like protein with hotdog domain